MDRQTNIKLSSHLVVTASLSCGITIASSLIYILLSIAALIFRYNCDFGLIENANGAQYFWKTIFSAYILRSDCPASIAARESVADSITHEYTFFVLAAITLSISIVSLVAAITLITRVLDEGATRYTNFVVFFYVGSCVASLVVDLTLATHFGLDYTYLTSQLGMWTAGAGSNYNTEVLRQGAFWLMSVALKGYVAPAINIIMLILLLVYVAEHQRLARSNQHSIHKLGVLAAFDQPRKPEDNNWSTSTQPDFSPFVRSGSQVNNGFNDDDSLPRTARREPTRSDFNYNQSFDRSDSWHHSHANMPQGARPFTYLEDVKRPMPSRPPPSPAVEAPTSWRRDPWPQGPPVPAPDYSPQPARRLKSALKPAYI